MGVVYAAYDEDLDRRIAVKVLARQSDAAAQRMQREAQALARINHPNVVQVYEVGWHEHQIYIAMEFVQGESLRQYLCTPPMAWPSVLELFVQAAEGLSRAHQAQLVHRDFKPDNVIVGEDRRVRVLDFGIARVADDQTISEPGLMTHEHVQLTRGSHEVAADRLTKTGQFLGTPAYMSPEQFQGHEVGPASDQFSFCVALYEALYGCRPFSHRSYGDLVTSVIDGKIDASPSGVNVPGWLRDIVVKGLQTSPTDRWTTMAELIDALRHDPAQRRREVLTWSMASMALLGVMGIAIWPIYTEPSACSGGASAFAQVWSEARADRIAARANSGFEAQSWEAARAQVDRWGARWIDGFEEACQANLRQEQSAAVLDQRMRCLLRDKVHVEALLTVFETMPSETLGRAPNAMSQLALPERCADLDWLAQEVPLPHDPAVRVRVQKLADELAAARAEYRAGLYESAADRSTWVAQQASTLGYKPLEAEAVRLVGQSDERSGNATKAISRLLDAYYLAVQSGDQTLETEVAIDVMANLGVQQRKFDEAEPWVRLAQARLERDGSTPQQRAGFLTAVGGIREQQNRLVEAQEALQQALQISLRNENPIKAASTHNALGLVHKKMGQKEQAEQDFEHAIEQWQAYGGSGHPQVADGYNNLGVLYMEWNRFEQSKIAHYKALEIRRNALGPHSATVGRVLNNLGTVARAQKDWDEAMRWFSESLTNLEASFGLNHPSLSIPLNNLGDIELERGAPTVAARYYARALAIDEEALGPEHQDLSYDLLGLGRCSIEEERYREALTYLNRALDLRQNHRFAPAEVGQTRFWRGVAQWEVGQRDAGHASVRRALDEAAGDETLRHQAQAWLDTHRSAKAVSQGNRPRSPSIGR